MKETRTQVVLPRGNSKSKLMFIGEAPGRNEDIQGLPFVGMAGKWFEAALEILGLKEEDFYLTNSVKCRPITYDGYNRAPTDLELRTCGEWLRNELEAIQPRVLVLMGQSALRGFFADTKISNVAGMEIEGHYLTQKYGTRIFCLYHPAVMIYRKDYYLPLYTMALENLKTILKEEGLIERDEA